jgi:hypothetical protein
MKRLVALVAPGVVLLSALVQAQTVQAPWPTDPGKLAVFIGKWSVEGDMKTDNSYGAPAGRYTYTEKYEWRPGEFLVKVTRTGQGPGADISHSMMLGYYVTTGQYSLIGSDLMTGAVVSGTGTNEGDTWTFANLGSLGAGRYFHERCTLSVTSETSFSVKCETSPDSRTWSTSFEGKATRS